MMIKNCIILYLFLSISFLLCNVRHTAAKDVKLHSHFDGNEVMLVSTIDGYITAVDAKTGAEKWKFKEAPVLESPIEIQHGFTFIPNPKTGQLYYLTEGRLSKLPFTIPELVRVSPCRSTDGILYAGNKKDVWISINPETGERSEAFAAPSPNSYCPISQANHIFVGKTEYHISMLDTRAKDRKWNATFVDYTSHLLPADMNYPYQHYTTSSDGWLVTVDAFSGKILWKRDFRQVIVNMYMLKKDGIHKLPSTAIGRETFDTLLDASAKNWKESLLVNPEESTGSFQSTLYVGQSTDAGLYALPAFVDSNTPIAPAYVGPPLLEGPTPLRLEIPVEGKEINVHQSTNKYQLAPQFKEINGDYLLLGYHQPPTLRFNNLRSYISGPTPAAVALLPHIQDPDRYLLMESDFFYDEDDNFQYRKCRGNKCSKRRTRRPEVIISGERNSAIESQDHDDDDDDMEIVEFMVRLVRRYPYYVLALMTTILTLLLTVFWLCGQLSALMRPNNFMHPVSWSPVAEHSQSSSRTSSTATKRSWLSSLIESASGSHVVAVESSVEVSEEIKIIGKLCYHRNKKLGQGAGGTAVYEGVFENRKVAVKRVMRENFDLVQREIKLLRDGGGDDHHNVIRYFCSESDNDFGYIALELCEASLDEYIKLPQLRARYPTLSKLNILKQATDGIAYLHSINFVHRDIKPRNILLLTQCQTPKVVISDFGLCKAIQLGHNSVSKTGIVGTEGWIAPEMISLNSQTCAVDIFSLGCVFHFVLTDGSHPFGESCRQDRIVQGMYDLTCMQNIDDLDRGTTTMAEELIADMIRDDPVHRPSANAVAAHPLFWTKDQQLQFLLCVSDRIESKKFSKDDKTPMKDATKEEIEMGQRLERHAFSIVGKSWFEQLSELLQQDLRKFRSYHHRSVQDLLRAMRNKYHHYQELTAALKEQLGEVPEGYVTYFTNIFPQLFMHVYAAMTYCAKESAFLKYYSHDLSAFYSRKFLQDTDFEMPRFKSPKFTRKSLDPLIAKIHTSKSTGEMYHHAPIVEQHEELSSSNWRAKPPSAPVLAETEPSSAPVAGDAFSDETAVQNTTVTIDAVNITNGDQLPTDPWPSGDATVTLITAANTKSNNKLKLKKKKKKKKSSGKAPLSVLSELEDANENDDSDECDADQDATSSPDNKTPLPPSVTNDDERNAEHNSP